MKRGWKKTLAALLCLVMMLTLVPKASYADYDGVAYRIEQLSSKFPNGKYWNHRVSTAGYDAFYQKDESWMNSVTSVRCNHNATSVGNYDCNYFDGGSQCWGFANRLYFEVFGVRCTNTSSTITHYDKWSIQPGDHVRLSSDHSVFVRSREGDIIYVIECNYDYCCGISWGREINLNNISVSWIKHANNWDEVNRTHETAPTTYTVTYNANGGSPTPPAQTKTQGQALTLSSTKPTKASSSAGSYTVSLNPNGGKVDTTSLSATRTTSYTFKNWNTASNGGGTSYASGGSYTADANVTLYAQWNSTTSTASVTLPTPWRYGYTFRGWATSSTASSGQTGSYRPSGNVTLYAIWKQEDLSSWSTTKPSNVDEAFIETGTQYRYSDRTVTGGWTKSGSGTIDYVQSWPAGFNTSHSLYAKYNKTPKTASTTSTKKVEVSASSVVTYIYWHWTHNNGALSSGNYNVTISDTPYSTDANGKYCQYFMAFEEANSHDNDHKDPNGKPKVIDYDCFYVWRGITSDGSWWWWRIPVYRQTYTEYTGANETWSDWSEWTMIQYPTGENRKSQSRTVYRCKSSIPAPAITGQPSSVSVGLGETATFTVTASGATSFQWEYQRPGESTWNNAMDNGQSATFRQTNVEPRHNGFKFRCKVTNVTGSVYSNAATLTVSSSTPVIASQPNSATASLGETATFTVTASGATGFQWEYQRPGESTWNDAMVNGQSATFRQTDVEPRHNGFKFRCKVTNAAGSVYSNAATLTASAGALPTITGQPSSVSVNLGETATFTVTASKATSFQWEYQRPGESTWNDAMDNGQSDTFRQTNVEPRHNGFKFRCKVTNAAGSVYSNAATLTASAGALPTITGQPSSVSVGLGETATFTVTASNATSYQWEYQRPGESTWNDAMVNGQSATFRQTDVEPRHNGFKFRCKVSNAAGSVYSNAATLTASAGALPTITGQPSSVSVNLGETATFKVTASNATGFQWEYQRPGESAWNDAMVNGQSATFRQTDVEPRHNGFKFRCKVTNAAGSVYSNAATLTVSGLVPTITGQPSSVSVDLGETATFAVTASDATSFQWQYQRPGESTWNDAIDNGQSAAFRQTNVEDRHHGFKFRCKVSNAAGSVYSNTATLTVSSFPPVITSQPNSVTVNLGETATFTVTASKATSFQWQYQRPGESTWNDAIDNGQSAAFRQTNVEDRHHGFKFRCKLSNKYGTVYSDAATLTVN